MNLIELHIIQSFPVTCLNRDDVGAPKSALFGGVQRARVSSQCWKRAIRDFAKEEQPGFFGGKRGHFLAELLEKAMIEKGLNENAAEKYGKDISEFIGKKNSKYKKGNKTEVALYFSPGEIEVITNQVVKDYNEKGKIELKKGKLKKIIENADIKDLADIAIFGRMVATDHTLMLEGAANFSHALSTHKVSSEIDFFSAVDEIMPEEEEGAGHIGTLEFNSACYYRYIGLNLDLLKDADHLSHFSDEEFNSVVSTFIKAAILAVPTARKNSMFGFNPPEFVLGLKRAGQPLSLANAFEKPIRPKNGYVVPSIEEMKKKFGDLKNTFGIEPEVEVNIPELNINIFIDRLLQNNS